MNTQTQTSSKTLLYLGLLILVLLGIALLAIAFAQLQDQGQQLSLPGFEVGVESAQQELGRPPGEPGPCPEFDYSRFTEQQWRYAFGSAHKGAGLRYATARLFQDFAAKQELGRPPGWNITAEPTRKKRWNSSGLYIIW